MLSVLSCSRQKILSNTIIKTLGRSSFSSVIKLDLTREKSFFNGVRKFSSTQSEKQKSEITKSEQTSGQVSTTFETVAKTTKTVSYGGVILVGVSVTAILFYTIFKELFSGKSPNSVYSKALDRCINDERVQISLGEPIKGYGEETRRGRRRHVSHLLYNKDGVDYLRMKFYLKGSRRKATVHLEMKENEKGKYEYRYFFVQLDEYPGTTIIIEDNRINQSSVLSALNDKEAMPLL